MSTDIVHSYLTAEGTADEADALLRSLAQSNDEHKRRLGSAVEAAIVEKKKKFSTCRKAKLSADYFMHIAFLITGQWGPHRSPVWRGAPIKRLSFLQRMLRLRSELADLRQRAKKKKAKILLQKKVLPYLEKAVDYILNEGLARRSIFAANGLPFGLDWNIFVKGNGKLPFHTYIELPMATCPGAGDCGVYVGRGSGDGKGWCYSFNGWRNIYPFIRQALNTLASVADQAFAELREGRKLPRVNPAPAGEGGQKWADYCARLLIHLTRKQRAERPVFLRLFVDGDFRNLRCLRDWMEACHRMGPAALGAGHHIEVYGYSKAWNLFRAAHHYSLRWPENYTLNLSAGSVYWNKPTTRGIVESLPITRGYFVPVSFKDGIHDFLALFHNRSISPKVSDAKVAETVAWLAKTADLSKADDLNKAVTDLCDELGITKPHISSKAKARIDVKHIQQQMVKGWIEVLHNNTRLRTLAKERLKRGDTKKEPTEKDIKAACLSIGLEDLLWRLGQGGTCPLSCGNCFDDHPDHPNTVHRCASKPGRAFGRPIAGGIGPTLRIPLH